MKLDGKIAVVTGASKGIGAGIAKALAAAGATVVVNYASSKADADAVVARIKKHLPDQVDVLIQSKDVPVKSALAQLTAVELKKLGVSVTDAEDQIVIKTADSEIDKTVEALLKAASVVEGQ